MNSARRQVRLACVVAAAHAHPVLAQNLGGASDTGVSVLRVVLALVVSIAAAVALALLLRRHAAGGGGRLTWQSLKTSVVTTPRIKVIETRRISTHGDVSLLRCDMTEYLIVSGTGGVKVLRTRNLHDGDSDESSGSGGSDA